MVNCPNCEAENGENIKFCTECGTKIEIADLKQENVNENICPDCSAELPANTRFCTDCGAKIEQMLLYDTKKQINCPKCSTEILAGTKFCTDCGTKIEETMFLDPNQEISCPKCSKSLPANSRFCTGCGTKIQQLTNSSDNKSQNLPVSDETVDSIKETGNGIVKGVGGLFNKATSKGGMFDKFSASIDDAMSGKTKKDYSNGYLRCNECGGYYKLQPGESPDDFGSCQCGGEMKYVLNILPQDR